MIYFSLILDVLMLVNGIGMSMSFNRYNDGLAVIFMALMITSAIVNVFVLLSL